jgi:hypothetical protein
MKGLPRMRLHGMTTTTLITMLVTQKRMTYSCTDQSIDLSGRGFPYGSVLTHPCFVANPTVSARTSV